MLGSLWDHLAQFWDYCGTMLGSLGDNFGSVLGSFWDKFGSILESLGDRFGIILGSFWDSFGIIFGFLWDPFGTLEAQWFTRNCSGGYVTDPQRRGKAVGPRSPGAA